MSDLRQYLDRIAGPERDPSTDAVDADVARGRVALRRRRQVHGLMGGALALVAVGALGVAAVTVEGPGDDRPRAATTGAPTTLESPEQTRKAEDPAGVRLVAFAGEQPEGFTIDVVPEGWEIQSSVPTTLLLAPIGLPDQDPNTFVDKIAISFQYEAPGGETPGERLTVGGKDAVMWAGEEGVRTLFVEQGDGAYLTIQMWSNLRWDTATIAEFAAGIAITDDVQRSRG
ncbi:hypothetical protein J2S43_002863 [Catenuloplanes nepalensis]|uniref:DUF4367 domain-containing protein n=1 Tax=Catenuloplanes nepalensis TaxID=587533 RepID=A0ABT9MSE0_9ACTN|nr:hypothetical protein [Catenuloplanes nepalensis]MDP9794351.1 hypothetical protein [Catenuloplanes nepalensis]